MPKQKKNEQTSPINQLVLLDFPLDVTWVSFNNHSLGTELSSIIENLPFGKWFSKSLQIDWLDLDR